MQVSDVLRKWVDAAGVEHLLWWCPGCKHAHHVPLNRWTWDGNVVKPTLLPSVRHFYAVDGAEHTFCHYFIKNGQIEYQGDCTHGLNRQIVPLPALPTDYGYPDE